MGTVKIDIYKKDRHFKDLSYSSPEDIYDILFSLDTIFEEYQNGNKEACCIYCDIINLSKQINNPALNEYINIQTGVSPLTIEDYDKTLVEVISERLNLTLSDCEDELYSSIMKMSQLNNELWEEVILIHYLNKKVNSTTTYTLPPTNITNESYWNLDYEKKYIFSKHSHVSNGQPEDIRGLLEIIEKNNQKIEQTTDKKERKKRIKYKIELLKDLSILKKHHDIPINQKNNQGTFYEIPYNDEDIMDYQDDVSDLWKYDKITAIANKVLTPKQLIIFNLYFLCNLKQTEIAEIVNETQGHISRDLNIAIDKIKKNI
jgi:hypothetical protein